MNDTAVWVLFAVSALLVRLTARRGRLFPLSGLPVCAMVLAGLMAGWTMGSLAALAVCLACVLALPGARGEGGK